MKKSISKCSLKISNALSLAITLFLCCSSSVAQQNVIIQTITPECTQDEIDSCKFEVVCNGDTDSYWDLKLCIARNWKYGSKKWYMDGLRYAAIMALKYEYVPACRDAYVTVTDYHRHKGDNSSMTIDEVFLCIACLQIGIEKGDQVCKKYLDELLKTSPSLLSAMNEKRKR